MQLQEFSGIFCCAYIFYLHMLSICKNYPHIFALAKKCADVDVLINFLPVCVYLCSLYRPKFYRYPATIPLPLTE